MQEYYKSKSIAYWFGHTKPYIQVYEPFIGQLYRDIIHYHTNTVQWTENKLVYVL